MDIAYYLEVPLKIGLAVLGFVVFLVFIAIFPSGYNGDLFTRGAWKALKQDYKDPNVAVGGLIGIVLILVKIGVGLTVIGLVTWGIKLVLY